MTLFGSMSMTAAELLQRRAALAVLEAATERDMLARRHHCGRVCDAGDFELKLAELIREKFE
jgi:hypothetical protein